MKRVLKIEINASETACSDESGLCRRMMTAHFGQRWYCGLFGQQELRDQYGAPSGAGTLQRCKECLEAERCTELKSP
jgi:hypothetical protein